MSQKAKRLDEVIKDCIPLKDANLPSELKSQGYVVICVPGDDDGIEPAAWFAVRLNMNLKQKKEKS